MTCSKNSSKGSVHSSKSLPQETNKKRLSSSQDGGISRHTLPPCTTKRRTTTNLKTKNNQNCQKSLLFGSPTIKKLKKKHSSRQVGGTETGSWGGEDSQQGGTWSTGEGEAAAVRVGSPTYVCR